MLEHPDLVRGGLLSEMLSPESDIAGTPAIGELKYVQTRYLREGNYIKRKVGRKKELKSKFKNAARAAAFGFIAGGGGQGSTRERNSQLQRLRSRPFSTRFG